MSTINRHRLAALMFVDVMGSADLSAHLGLDEYDSLISDFQTACLQAVDQEMKLSSFPADGNSYEFRAAGDELKVFVYDVPLVSLPPMDQLTNQLSMLLRLAFRVKLRWLISDFNKKRLHVDKPAVSIGVGINCGPIVVGPHPRCQEMPTAEGYAINLTKRIEQTSRQGRFCRVMLGQEAYRLIREQSGDMGIDVYEHAQLALKGFGDEIRIYEVRSLDFLSPRAVIRKVVKSLTEPECERLVELAERAVHGSRFDLWAGVALVMYYCLKGDRAQTEDVASARRALKRGAEVAEKLLDYDNSLLGMLKFLGYAYDFLGMPARAVTSNERAVQLCPHDYMAQFNLAVALSHYHDLSGDRQSLSLRKRVLQEYLKARKIAQSSGFLGEGGHADWKLPLFIGHSLRALAEGKREQGGRDDFAQEEKSLLREAVREYTEAIRVLKSGETDLHERWLTEAYFHCGQVLEPLKRRPKALKAYTQCIELGKGSEHSQVMKYVRDARERLRALEGGEED